ncbi:MAG: hypothetical protein NC102_07405 [Clostridium sp.]|nr:hypothetical protein [Clostridium sp.]
MIAIKETSTSAHPRIFVDLKPTAAHVTNYPRGIMPVPINLAITIDKGFFSFSYSSDIELKAVSISDPSQALKFSPDKLLAVAIGDGEPTPLAPGKCVKARLSAKETPARLLIFPGAITDCDRQGAFGADFPVEITLELKRGKESATRAITVPFTMIRELRKPYVLVESVASAPYTMDSGPKNIGRIIISNIGSSLFEPAIDCACAFEAKSAAPGIQPGAIFADFGGALGSMAQALPTGKTLIKGLQTMQRGDQGTWRAEVPIYADFSKMPNPVDCPGGHIDFEISATVEAYNPDQPGKKQVKSDSSEIAIVPNATEADLRVKVRDNFDGDAWSANASGGIVPLPRVDFQPGAAFKKIFYIGLSNTATKSDKPKAGISVRNVSIETVMPKNCHAEYSEGDTGFISLSGAEREIFLPSAPNNSHDLKLELSFSKINELYVKTGSGERNYNATIPVKLRFDYYIDTAGDHDVPGIFEANSRHFECTLRVATHQMPPKEWLAIDFGTSAIVSEYDGKLIDLHKVKRSLFSDYATDTYEKGTPFLSSNLTLRQSAGRQELSQLCSDNPNAEAFDQMALCLSPTSDTERANIRTALPYLKLIVGYDLLPNIQNYAGYSYTAIDPESGQPRRMPLQESINGGEAEPTPLARVDKIFEEVYRQLFRYYITAALNDRQATDRLNQIVLTIPNTYTPEHIKRIEKIVREAFSHTHLRNVRFVSESDAVACFYQSNWAKINAPLQRQRGKDLHYKERVLVYDMGAGTLDLTLFTRTVENDTPHVNVFGKMGIAKAGNYLDCLLARILSKKAPSLAAFTDPEKIGNDADRLIRAFELKEFVKNKVKPLLSDGESQFTLERNLNWGLREKMEFDIIKDILEDPDFKAYINSCTEELIVNFFRFYGKKAKNIGEEDMKIDTVLLSGRSTKLKPLRLALAQALRKYQAADMKIVEIGSAADQGDAFDKAKTVVVEGALDYVTKYARDNDEAFESDTITACYGIIYRNTAGQEKYLEIFNPYECAPIGQKRYKGMTVKAYSTPEKVVNLKNSSTITLVQTYLANIPSPTDPNRTLSYTEREWNKGNREYITVMSEFSTSSFPNPEETHISIMVNDRNELILRVNGLESEPTVHTKIDINSESNIMSLWPMMSTKAKP